MAWQRPLVIVPRQIIWVACGALLLQIGLNISLPRASAKAQALPPPPSLHTLHVSSLGEPIGLAKFLMLSLQAFDNQPGVSLPFRDLDYPRVRDWLTRILQLDPHGQYPLLFASHLYAEVPQPDKQRLMLDFVYREFLIDPNRRWPWLAHCVIIARHKLNDMPLAAQYAAAIRRYATGANVPGWAKQMEIFLRADMNEIETARVMLGGLIDSGQITEANELHFLTLQLRKLESRLKSSISDIDVTN
ncbi:MAG: hypothetical protein WCD07_10055 [Burkholderiales bacterium]